MPIMSIDDLQCAIASMLVLVTAAIGVVLYVRSDSSNQKKRTFAILFSVGLLSCCASFWILEATSMGDVPIFRPSIHDVSGVYFPEDRNTEELMQIGYTTRPVYSSITFNANGSFSTVNIPNFVIWGFDKENLDFASGSGSWKFEGDMVNGEWNLLLHFGQINGQASDKNVIAYMSGHKAPYIVYFLIGELHSINYQKK